MTDDQLEAAFTKAQNKWLLANPHTAFNTNQQRYFFWAGAEFGMKVVGEIHRNTYGPVQGADDVEGAPV